MTSGWYNLGVTYGKTGQRDRAIEAYREALRIDPRDALAWNNLGVEYSLKGERARVVEVYEQLQILDPTLADKFFNLVVAPR